MEGGSMVEYFGAGSGHSCGYCKKDDTNFSYGMWAHQLTPHHYQALLDRGWRRSGMYVYRPELDIQCCPQYTIKCEANLFKPSHSHKKIIKTFNRYINYGIVPKRYQGEDGKVVVSGGGDDNDGGGSGDDGGGGGDDGGGGNHDDGGGDGDDDGGGDDGGDVAMAMGEADNEDDINDEIGATNISSSDGGVVKVKKGGNKTNNNDGDGGDGGGGNDGSGGNKGGDGGGGNGGGGGNDGGGDDKNKIIKKEKPKAGVGADVSKPVAQKAKVMRMMKKKMKETGEAKVKKASKTKNVEKSLEHFLTDFVENPVHQFEVITIPSQQLLQQIDDETITNNTTNNTSNNTTNATNNTTANNTTNNTTNSLIDSFQLFNNYQSTIHNDHNNYMSSYCDFLVKSPVITKASPTTPKGSFHQQYYIDGELVCVGVVDVLWGCVSSVYLFYHPKYAFLSLGTYTALRELAYTRQLNQHDNNMQYYYMGFYIHSCTKMKYKAQFRPAYLLCPESFTWQPIGRSLQLIDKFKYSRLAHIDQIDEDILGMNTNEVKVLHNGGMTDEEWKRRRRRMGRDSDDDRVLHEYANLVGKKCAYSMMLFRK